MNQEHEVFGLTFLPDRDGPDPLQEESDGLMVLGEEPEAILNRLVAPVRAEEANENGASVHLRGLMALVLLHDSWLCENSRIYVKTIRQQDSPAIRTYLMMSGVRSRQLLILEKDGKRRILGSLDQESILLPAANLSGLEELLPECCSWYIPSSGRFTDAIPYLDEHDRLLLLSRLKLMEQRGFAVPKDYLTDVSIACVSQAQLAARGDKDMLDATMLRLKAVLSGGERNRFTPLKKDVRRYRRGSVNPLLSAFRCQEGLNEELPEAVTSWFWNGAPFARSHTVIGLESVHSAAEQRALQEIGSEIDILERFSPIFRRELKQAARQYLAADTRMRLCGPIRRSLQETADMPETPEAADTLTWPWQDAEAVADLSADLFGTAEALRAPFAERLTQMPDTLDNDAIREQFRVSDMQFLPPITPDLLMALTADPLFNPKRISYIATGTGITVRVAVTPWLNIERSYDEEALYAPDAGCWPVIAVWPDREHPAWKLHQVGIFQRLISVQPFGADIPSVRNAEGWSVMNLTGPVAWYVFSDDESVLGVLPDLPEASAEAAPCGTADIAIDFGTSAIACAVSMNGVIAPLPFTAPARRILSAKGEYPEGFWPMRGTESVLPDAVVLYNPREYSRVPADGHIAEFPDFETVSAYAAERSHVLYSGLKQPQDTDHESAARLLLRQIMLAAVHTCVIRGAGEIRWQFTCPDGYAPSAEQIWKARCMKLADEIMLETGIPMAGDFPVFVSEAKALVSYWRDYASMGGSMMLIDVGGGKVSLALHLDGIDAPIIRQTLPLGVQAVLLQLLTAEPRLPADDFIDVPDRRMSASVRLLTTLLEKAKGRSATVDQCRILLDSFIGENLTGLAAAMDQMRYYGQTTALEAITESLFAMLFLEAGIMLDRAAQDAAIRERLPQQITVCLSGRGSLLFSAMPAEAKNRLAAFLRMPLDPMHPVQAFALEEASTPKMEAVLGTLTSAGTPRSDTPAIAALKVSPELLCDYLMQLRALFPQSSERLFPGLTTVDQYGRVYLDGLQTIDAAVRKYFDGETADTDRFFACLLSMMHPLMIRHPADTDFSAGEAEEEAE